MENPIFNVTASLLRFANGQPSAFGAMPFGNVAIRWITFVGVPTSVGSRFATPAEAGTPTGRLICEQSSSETNQ